MATDALIKVICRSALAGRDIVLLKNIITLSLVENTGVAFSFLGSAPSAAMALSGIMVIAVLVLLLRCSFGRLCSIALSMLAAGGTGNLLDRLVTGAVTDMIRLDFISFPVFNFADICVTLGAVLIVFAVLFTKEGENDAVRNH